MAVTRQPDTTPGQVEWDQYSVAEKYILVRGEKTNEIGPEYFGGQRAFIAP
jgi:hypothetical protein